MRVKVLGAAAGGGFPQWNCGCANCQRARAGDPLVKPRTQASLALSADGVRWVLLNASPDLPAQINREPALQPDGTVPRASPIAAIVISSGDVDCLAGLLSLRERQPFALYAQDFVLDILRANQIFDVLDRDLVPFISLTQGAPNELRDGSGAPLGLTLEAFPVPGKIPLYQEAAAGFTGLDSQTAVIGLSVTAAAGQRLLYIPGCGAVTEPVRACAMQADALFFDGTLWRDDEMIIAGAGSKTGRRMGHISVSGADGSIAALAGVAARRKIFIHLNNTNPMLCDDSAEAAFTRAAGWEIAYDGMELRL